MSHLQALPDPRVDRRKEHLLSEVLCMGLCCVLSGGENFVDMEDFGHAKEAWLRTFLTLPGGIPSHDTFNRIFSAIKPEHFMECFPSWTQGLRRTLGQEIVAVDGKALRRARNQGRPIPDMVNAWAMDNGLALGQWRVDDKSNEITAIPHLLRVLELAGCIVTLDAMGCQKNIAREISEADADYVLARKGNQQTVHEEVEQFFATVLAEQKMPLAQRTCKVKPQTWQHGETVEKDHGRARTAHAPQNLSTLRCLALNLLKQNKTKKASLRAKRNIAAWDNDFLKQVLNFQDARPKPTRPQIHGAYPELRRLRSASSKRSSAAAQPRSRPVVLRNISGVGAGRCHDRPKKPDTGPRCA